MSFLNQLFNPIQHCEDAAIHLCQKLQVKITASTLKKDLLHHPDYPSLMSIGDVLSSHGVANQGIELTTEYFGNLPVPFIAYAKSQRLSHNIFVPVYDITVSGFEVYNPETGKVEQKIILELLCSWKQMKNPVKKTMKKMSGRSFKGTSSTI
jgi:hypothetical protein